MSFSDPNSHVFVTGEIVSAANLKTYVGDNIVALRNNLGAIGYLSAAATAFNGVFSVVYFTATASDNAGIHNASPNHHRFTFPIAGQWDVDIQIDLDPGGAALASHEIIDRIVLNGTTPIGVKSSVNCATVPSSGSCHAARKFAASDYVQAEVWHNRGADLSLLSAILEVGFQGANS